MTIRMAFSMLAFVFSSLLIAIFMVMVFVLTTWILIPDMFIGLNSESLVASLVGSVLISIFGVMVLGIIIRRSQIHGAGLILWLVVTVYGLQTFMGQLDAVIFFSPLGEYAGTGNVIKSEIPLSWLLNAFIIGLPIAVLTVPLAVLLHGRLEVGASSRRKISWPKMRKAQWAWKLLAIIIVYECLYFTFGYFIAWQNPAVREFYQGVDHGNFLAQMIYISTTTPALFLVQVLRALLWALVALPVIAIFKTRVLTGTLLTAILLATPWINIFVLIPDFVPPEVGLTHLIEVSSSNFILGCMLYWLLHRPHDSMTDLFSIRQNQTVSLSE